MGREAGRHDRYCFREAIPAKQKCALSGSPFGCLQRIDFPILCFGRFSGYMAGEVAVAVFPLRGRLRESTAIPAGSKFNRAVAAVAPINDLMADSTIIGTSLGCHERARFPIAYSCTVHRIHPLSLWSLIIKKPGSYGTRPH